MIPELGDTFQVGGAEMFGIKLATLEKIVANKSWTV
jgi:hypothetical protein